MKHTQVSRDGTVTEPVSAYKHPWTRTDRQPLAQLTYGALLSGRTSMVGDSANTAKRALTIATRYAAVRRQFSSGKGKVCRSHARGAQLTMQVETQILDYPIHQRRLMVS